MPACASIYEKQLVQARFQSLGLPGMAIQLLSEQRTDPFFEIGHPPLIGVEKTDMVG